MKFDFDTSFGFAKEMDENDSLKHFRNRFFISDEHTIYLDGNSLGRLPTDTKQLISEITEKQWGTELIESWNKHWYEKPSQLDNKIARIVGASPAEVLVCDSTLVNLYKLAHAALNFQKEKKSW